MATILWVEDQRHWLDRFSACLTDSVFDQHPNRLLILDRLEAVRDFVRDARQQPDVALLDARLHGNDQAGFTVSQALLARWPELPVIYLSEHSGTQVEAQAFSLNSTQDFIAKHQRNVEQVLCWRIRALLRQQAMRAPRHQGPDRLDSGPLSIDLVTWEIYWQGTKLMNPRNPRRPLPPTPRKILKQLVQCAPRPQTALQIAQALELDEERFSNAGYRQHIKTLREAIDQACPQDFIQLCKAGRGLVTFGDAGAYCWVNPEGEPTP